MSGTALPPTTLPHERRLLFESSDISVVDFRCSEHGTQDGPEEPNPTHSVAFIRRGVFRRTVRGRRLVADASHVLFFNASELYQYAHPIPGGDDCTILTVSTPAALELVARHAPRHAEQPDRPFCLGHGLTSPRAARLHYELLALVRQSASRLALEDVLANLADEAVRAAYAQHAASGDDDPLPALAQRRRRDLVEAAKLIINERLESPPSLRTLAHTLGCSPFHLSRTFHRTEGSSLRRYVGRLRARVAAHHLANGAPDLTQLALHLGYTDHSHFTNAFHREWGHPPSQFRARHRRR